MTLENIVRLWGPVTLSIFIIVVMLTMMGSIVTGPPDQRPIHMSVTIAFMIAAIPWLKSIWQDVADREQSRREHAELIEVLQAERAQFTNHEERIAALEGTLGKIATALEDGAKVHGKILAFIEGTQKRREGGHAK